MNKQQLEELETALRELLGHSQSKYFMVSISKDKAISSETYLEIREMMNLSSSPGAIKDWFGYIYYYYSRFSK